MSNSAQYYCWYCYAESATEAGPCARCARPIAGPPDVNYPDRLLWALRHPLPDRRLMAVIVLGTLREDRAASRLRELVYDRDPYLAAAALRSLTNIIGPRCRGLLIESAATGPAPVRYAARQLLTNGLVIPT